jgi:hypothetical protein
VLRFTSAELRAPDFTEVQRRPIAVSLGQPMVRDRRPEGDVVLGRRDTGRDDEGMLAPSTPRGSGTTRYFPDSIRRSHPFVAKR